MKNKLKILILVTGLALSGLANAKNKYNIDLNVDYLQLAIADCMNKRHEESAKKDTKKCKKLATELIEKHNNKMGEDIPYYERGQHLDIVFARFTDNPTTEDTGNPNQDIEDLNTQIKLINKATPPGNKKYLPDDQA